MWSRLAVATGVVLVVGLLVAIYGPLGDWAGGSTVRDMEPAKERAAAINAVRQTLLATAAGTAALVGLAFTGRTYYLSRRGQLTDRYTKAIAQLASDKLEERLGGIYALEHLMVESARDHLTVVDVLAAFIREHAIATSTPRIGPVGAGAIPDGRATDDSATGGRPPRPATDVQAALTVLGRRPDRHEPHPLDLSHTDLRGANLREARLARANLDGAQLQGAVLNWAQLQGANLVGAQLQGAWLLEAQLQGAFLTGAQLQGASLRGAQLQGAGLAGAMLLGARITVAQLLTAHGNESSVLDAPLRQELEAARQTPAQPTADASLAPQTDGDDEPDEKLPVT